MATTQTVKVQFTFPQSFTETDYKAIERKVNTVRKNAGWESTYSIYASTFQIEVMISFDVVYENKFFDAMRAPLQRLIDSHKEAATYGWSVYTPQKAVA